MVTTTDAPTKNQEAVALGHVGGRSKSIQAVSRRIEALVADAPALNPRQLAALSTILRTATAAIEAPQAVRSA